MAKLDRDTVAFHGLLDALFIFVKAWRPGALPSERAYRDALFELLHAAKPDGCRVEREYRHEGTTADLYVHWVGYLFNAEVYFELKRDLRSKSECDRLVGQLEGLKPDKHKILVVLCGKTDTALLDRVKQHFSMAINGPDPQMAVLLVP